MDQGLRDQNSEMRDLSPANHTEPDNLVDLMLKQPSKTQKHGSFSQLEEAPSNSPVTKVYKHGSSKEGPEKVEMGLFQSKTQPSKITPSIQNPRKQNDSRSPPRS